MGYIDHKTTKVIAKVRKREPDPNHDKHIWLLICFLAAIYTLHGMAQLFEYDTWYR